MHLVKDRQICNPQSFCVSAAFCVYPKRPLTRLPFDIWWQRWDGRSTVGGCVRNACVCEVQGCSSRRGRQCDDVPSLHMIPGPSLADITHNEMCIFILFGDIFCLQTFYYWTEIEEWQDQLGGSDVAGKNAGFHILKKIKTHQETNEYGQFWYKCNNTVLELQNRYSTVILYHLYL